jgi:hypothetical protein
MAVPRLEILDEMMALEVRYHAVSSSSISMLQSITIADALFEASAAL